MNQPPVVVRGNLPQRLLPPHRAHDGTEQAAAGIVDLALRRFAAPDKCSRDGAAKQQKPKSRFRKASIRKRIDRISERILRHGSVPVAGQPGEFTEIRIILSRASAILRAPEMSLIGRFC